MKTVEVEVQADYLQRLARVEPIQALTELVWNSLDADAQRVEVTVYKNELGGLTEIIVADDGLGMPPSSIEQDFGYLGGSWKQVASHTRKEKRALHGKGGQGRFRAFALGSYTSWKTKSKKGNSVIELEVKGYIGKLGKFEVSESSVVEEEGTGTKVTISELRTDLKKFLIGESAFNDFSVQVAPYLRQYPHVNIIYNGKIVDPSLVINREDVYSLDDTEIDGIPRAADLEIIEWKIPTSRALYLCDQNGFSLAEQKPGIQASGYEFTAYLKSDYFRELDQANLIALGESNPGVSDIMEAGKKVLRNHFKKRKEEDEARIVEKWKQDEIYPYLESPASEIERSEQKVFDLVAVNVSKYLPDFDKSDLKTRRFQFHLLKQAIERNPESLQRILTEVLELPREAQDDLAGLLKETTLMHVINAAKVVADRLNFLRALEILVFDPQSRETLRERTQLHRILTEETWIFGEEFNLSVDDQSLTEVLRKHLALLGREPETVDKVKRVDGKTGIVDLMLSRRIPQPKSEKREHLVIELKRPKQPINSEVLTQTKSYAFAVQKDERFKDTDTVWHFWAISNTMDEYANQEAHQEGNPDGLVFKNKNIYIWVKTWSQVIEQCRGRLTFYQERLKYEADYDTALDYLHTKYEKYLPANLEKRVKPQEA